MRWNLELFFLQTIDTNKYSNFLLPFQGSLFDCGSHLGSGSWPVCAHGCRALRDEGPGECLLMAIIYCLCRVNATRQLNSLLFFLQIMFSFLSVGWGLMADIDIESERLRALGGQRFTIWAVHRLISLRTYRGRLSYLPATHLIARETSPSVYERKGSVNGESEKRRSSLKHSKSCTAALSSSVMDGGDFKDSGEEDGGVCDACDMMDFGEVLSLETSISGGGGGGGVNGRSRMDSFYSVGSKRSSYFSMTDSVYQDVHDGEENGAFGASGTNGVPNKVRMYGPSSNIPALTEPVPSSWTVMEGEFVMVHTAHLTHLGSDCYFAKQSQLNDGVIWMVVIKGGIPRTQLLSFLLGLSSGTHVPEGHSDYVKMIPCTAFRIEPEGNQGHLTVDGERVELGAIQGEVFDGMVNVTVPDVGE